MDQLRPTPLTCPIITAEPLRGFGRTATEYSRAVWYPIVLHRRLILGNLITLIVLVAMIAGVIWLTGFEGTQGSTVTSGPLPNATSLWSETP